MIAYNTKEAQMTFAALADVLDRAAKIELVDGNKMSDDDILKAIDEIASADPTGNTIRQPFEMVWSIARIAGDFETEKDLRTRHAQLIESFNAICQCDEDRKLHAATMFSASLETHAAYIRAVGQAIGKPRKTDMPESGIGAKLDKLIEQGVTVSAFKGEAQTDITKIASGRLRDIKSVSGLQKDNNELKAELAQSKTK